MGGGSAGGGPHGAGGKEAQHEEARWGGCPKLTAVGGRPSAWRRMGRRAQRRRPAAEGSHWPLRSPGRRPLQRFIRRQASKPPTIAGGWAGGRTDGTVTARGAQHRCPVWAGGRFGSAPAFECRCPHQVAGTYSSRQRRRGPRRRSRPRSCPRRPQAAAGRGVPRFDCPSPISRRSKGQTTGRTPSNAFFRHHSLLTGRRVVSRARRGGRKTAANR